MRAAARNAFVPFSAPLEGVLGHMYLDVKGLATTAIGVLVDPVEYALPLPWLRADGSRATEAEVRDEWRRVKARQDWRLRGGRIYGSITLLHLDEAGILSAVSRKLDEMDLALARRFDGYSEMCADAQLGLLSISWALGPAFRFPRFAAAVDARDWLLAAEECTISTVGNPGVRPRNDRNLVLFRNAAVIHRDGLDRDVLYWPRDLFAGAPTLPQLHDDDGEPTVTVPIEVPEMREPPSIERVVIVHPKVPLGRAALDGELPKSEPPDDAA